MVNFEDEDVAFIKKFLQASGSLKEIARQYGVTYPTVRLRLDKLIQKIQISEDTANEPYVALIKRLVVNDNGIILLNSETEFYQQVADQLIAARKHAKRQMDNTIAVTYCEVRRMIVERVKTKNGAC